MSTRTASPLEGKDSGPGQRSLVARFIASGNKTQIPVRNLWLLMVYASKAFQDNESLQMCSLEENPDELFDMVSEVLIKAVERRLRRTLGREYEETQAILARVRGRIDGLETESKMLLAQGRVACRFDQLSVDTPRNRLLLRALDIAARWVTSPDLERRARWLVIQLAQYGVSPRAVDARSAKQIVLRRNDREDVEAIDAARLLLDMNIPMEDAGNRTGRSPLRDATTIRRLYERAVRGFYQAVLRPNWIVSQGETHQRWPITEATTGLASILPIMRTDIQLERFGRRIVVETKFADALTPGPFGGPTLSRDHIFQLYAYVQSQDGRDETSLSTEGVLLYPVTGYHLDESAVIQGHRYRIMTVDLTADARSIRERLFDVVAAPTAD